MGYTPGVYIQPRFGAEEARLSIRGSGIQRTFHLRGIKLLQDGFRNQSEQWNKRMFSNYGIRFNDNLGTRFYVNLVDSKSKLPGSLTMVQMKQNPK